MKKHTRSSEDRIILLMDNHESHCTLHSILYATENGYHICNSSSPLLSSITANVMGPFKGKLLVAKHDWMTANPGKVITIHDLASLTNAIRGAADKSLGRPTSRCRTESIVSFERGVCSCAELQVFSCYIS